MAYIVGLLSTEEEAELIRRGWKVEKAPAVDFDTGKPWRDPERMRMVWVDADLFCIMDGPDWDKGPTHEGVGTSAPEGEESFHAPFTATPSRNLS